MTKQASNITINLQRVFSFFFIISTSHSIAVRATPISDRTSICEPGSYKFTADGSDCQVCPPGTYSDAPGSEFCKLCLDTIYNDEGANSAELWNGSLYCVLLGSSDDDFLTSNSGDTPESIGTVSPTKTLLSEQVPSTVPSSIQSSESSGIPSTMPSKSDNTLMPSEFSSLVDGDEVPMDGFRLVTGCNDRNSETGRFEWHSRCKQCPAKNEMILFLVLVLVVLAMIIISLEFLLPVCFTAHFWLGVEHLQMLYLIGLSSISWSPAAEFIFEKVLPIFALDLNASFSLQCVINKFWPQQEAADQLLVLLLPMIFLTSLTFISKISGNRIIRDETVSRWITMLLYMGYLKLVLSSFEALRLPTSWSADDLSIWVDSDTFYSTVGGLAGLLFYGMAFPIWFLYSVFRYNLFNVALVNASAQEVSSIGQQDKEIDERQHKDLKKETHAKEMKELFMMLGIFPINLRRNPWWWPGVVMLRKFLFAAFLFNFPNRQTLYLVVLILIYFASLVVQKYYLSFGDEHREVLNGFKKKWYSIAAVDAVLQLCLLALTGVAFFSSWSVEADENTRSLFHERMEDCLVLLIFFMSSVYMTVTFGVCCAQPEPRFLTVVSQMVVKKNDRTSTSAKDSSVISVSRDESSITRTFSRQSSQSNDPGFEIDFFTDCKDSALNNRGIYPNPVDKKYGAESEPQTIDCESANSSPYLVEGGQEEYTRKHLEEEKIETTSSRNSPGIFLSNSSIDANEDISTLAIEDDMETVYEEVWVDENTGEEICDPKQGTWVDAETGLVAVLPKF